MPRETVHAPHPGDDTEAPFFATVGWDKGHDVQLGVLIPGGESVAQRLYNDPRTLARIGEQFIAYLSGGADGAVPKGTFNYPADYGDNEAMLADYQRLGSLVLFWLDEARGFHGENDGLWVRLTRDMANRLVTLLRKGRDAAYGRDA